MKSITIIAEREYITNMDIKDMATNVVKRILKPWIPKNLITEELSGIYGNAVLAEMGEIIKYYNIYNNGAEFATSAEDYMPSDLHYKKIKALINKEARFMFGKSPDIKIKSVIANDTKNERIDIMQRYINEVLKKNHFNANLIKAAKDCFIGKRIAIFCNFNIEYGITISFVPSLEFIYEEDNYGNLSKIIAFFNLNNAVNANDQRIQRKKYWLENGFCHISEGIYDGAGNLVETIIEDEITKFEYIPAVVILNDGLTGDSFGESEVDNLFEFEQYYSKLSNLDIDAEKQSMNPTRWARDMDPESTKNLSIAPGSFWDLASNDNAGENRTGDVGILEPTLNYSSPMETTLNRIRDSMYEQLDMPNVSTSDLQGIVSSGKTFKAIYWGLIGRCDEKMMAWKYNLELLIKCLIDGAFYYPEIANMYSSEKLLEVEYTVDITNQYLLPEDENEEKTIDLEEVSQQTMSKKSYMKKWRNLTDEEADEEIRQIALERQILDDSFFPSPNNLNTDNDNE